jgi:hypothetical protein
MHLDNLITPHPRKLPEGALQEPLVGKIDPETISGLLLDAQELGPDMYADVLTDCTDYVCRETRRALWYPEDPVRILGRSVVPKPYPDLEHLESEQSAGCYGFTLVASELMERSSMPHYIAYINGHSALLVPLGNGRIRYADPLIPALNHEASVSLNAPNLLNALSLKPTGKQAVHFNTTAMTNALGLDWEGLRGKHQWMGVKKGDNRYPDKRASEKEGLIVISVYHPSEGRFMLEAHSKLLQAMHDKNFTGAANFLDAMGYLYPDVDLRKRHSTIIMLVRSLAQLGHLDLAHQSITTYIKSISDVSDDARIGVLHGDCLREIASTTRCEASANGAVAAYEAAAKTTTVEGLSYIIAKLRKARQLAAAVCDETINA